jgi:hypothetical protein
VGKSANISELINGETVTINPKHPQAAASLALIKAAANESANRAAWCAKIFENEPRDQLIARIAGQTQRRYLDLILDKMHELVNAYGDRQSIAGYAFDLSRYLGGAISARELERMYREKYMQPKTNESNNDAAI